MSWPAKVTHTHTHIYIYILFFEEGLEKLATHGLATASFLEEICANPKQAYGSRYYNNDLKCLPSSAVSAVGPVEYGWCSEAGCSMVGPVEHGWSGWARLITVGPIEHGWRSWSGWSGWSGWWQPPTGPTVLNKTTGPTGPTAFSTTQPSGKTRPTGLIFSLEPTWPTRLKISHGNNDLSV